jgi:hypothetical protein
VGWEVYGQAWGWERGCSRSIPSFSCFSFPSVIRQSALLVNTECPYVPMQNAATLRCCDAAGGDVCVLSAVATCAGEDCRWCDLPVGSGTRPGNDETEARRGCRHTYRDCNDCGKRLFNLSVSLSFLPLSHDPSPVVCINSNHPRCSL